MKNVLLRGQKYHITRLVFSNGRMNRASTHFLEHVVIHELTCISQHLSICLTSSIVCKASAIYCVWIITLFYVDNEQLIHVLQTLLSYFHEVQFGCILLHPVPKLVPGHNICLCRHKIRNGQRSISGQTGSRVHFREDSRQTSFN